MRAAELVAKWETRLKEFERLHVQVDGAILCREVLHDLSGVCTAGDNQTLTLTEAASCSGYSREHLGRLMRAGKIPNAGRPNAPRIRASDLPRKAGHLPPERVPEQLSDASKGQIVRSIVDAQRRSTR